ncbi:MAG: transcriptional coactivator p15/PC4 family protein [Pseudomonadota bacterium]
MSLIASIPKNSREEIRVSRDDYNGHDLINIRVFYDAGEGEMRPGKQGVAFKAALLPEVLGALEKALRCEAAQ